MAKKPKKPEPKPRKPFVFMVTLVPPRYAKADDVQRYIRDALAVYKGCLPPPGTFDEDNVDYGDPMFNLDPDAIRVTPGGTGAGRKRSSVDVIREIADVKAAADTATELFEHARAVKERKRAAEQAKASRLATWSPKDIARA